MEVRALRLLPVLLLLAVAACGAAPVGTPTSATPTAVALTAPPLAPLPTVTPDTVPEALKTPSPSGPTLTPTIDAPVSLPSPLPTASPTLPVGAACVSDPNPKLTHVITELDKIDFIMPVVVGSSNWLKNRTYFHVKTDEATGLGYRVPVYVPVDMTLTGITRYVSTGTDFQGNVVEVEQYDLRFSVTCEVTIEFDHVSSLVGAAANVQPLDAVTDTRDAMKSVLVTYEGGELIGYTVGTSTGHTWDFIMSHTEMPLQFVNQARYENVGDLRHILYAPCPYDFYDEELRSAYLALAGGWGEGAVGADGCLGSPDVGGTIAGGWFASPWVVGDNEYVADWAPVVHLGADGMVEINDGRRMVRTRASDPTFALPAMVTGEHCYEHMNSPSGYAYLE